MQPVRILRRKCDVKEFFDKLKAPIILHAPDLCMRANGPKQGQGCMKIVKNSQNMKSPGEWDRQIVATVFMLFSKRLS